MNAVAHKIERHFFKGEFRQAIGAATETKNKLNGTALGYLISSHASIGQINEAEALFEGTGQTLDGDPRFAARFFLAVGQTRAANLGRAKEHLWANQNESTQSPVALFYRHQGFGIFFFYQRKFKSCQIQASHSLKHSVSGKFLLGHALALDLLGHVYIQNGLIPKGLENLSRGISLTKKLKNRGLQSSFQASLLINQIHFGFFPGNSIEELTKEISRTQSQDSFTVANLRLELSRRLTLAGHFGQAEEQLKKAIYQIYGDAPPRQEALLNLRMGELNYQRGDFHQALIHIGSARRTFQGKIDPFLIQQILGLELKVMRAVGFPQESLEKQSKKLSEYSLRFQNAYNLRHLARNSAPKESAIAIGQDLTGDLIEAIGNGKAEAIFSALNAAVLTPLIDHYGLQRGEPTLVVDRVLGILLRYSRTELTIEKLKSRGLSTQMLGELTRGFRTKAQLVEKLWGYQYDSLRHDSLIYTQIKKLKQTLGRLSRYLRMTPDGYGFDSELEVKVIVPFREKRKTMARETKSAPETLMNYRQIKIMARLEPGLFLSTPECAKRFKVSEITANRDLRELVRIGCLRKVGKARATRYTKA